MPALSEANVTNRRFIEESFPVKEVSAISAGRRTSATGTSAPYTSGGRGVPWLLLAPLPTLLSSPPWMTRWSGSGGGTSSSS